MVEQAKEKEKNIKKGKDLTNIKKGTDLTNVMAFNNLVNTGFDTCVLCNDW